jgi:hypothetical protein
MPAHALAHGVDTPRLRRSRGAALAPTKAPGRWGAILGDLLALLAVVVFIPFVMLGVGLPVVLAVQLVLWVGRLF